MNVFDLLGYRSDRPYSNESKTNVGYFALVNAGGAQSYTLAASHGSYAITGQTATFTKTTAYALTASHGSYTITGEDATFAYNPAVLTNLETLIKLRSFTEHRRF